MKELPTTAQGWLIRLDPDADLAQRHLWLQGVLQWLRGPQPEVPAVLRRLGELLDAADTLQDWPQRWQQWWTRFAQEVDLAPLLSEFGLASRPAFLAECVHRWQAQLLPASPATTDAAELFAWLFPDPRDARWLRAIPAHQWQRMVAWLHPKATAAVPPERQSAAVATGPSATILLDALALCVGQISAAGCLPELRLRMSTQARAGRAFQELPVALEALRQALHNGPDIAQEQAAQRLRQLLDACRRAAYTVYGHLEEYGISVGVVFRLRQLRERVLRAKYLLKALCSLGRPRTLARFVAELVQLGQDNRSVRALWVSSTQLTAARVAERSAKTGEHYITRDWAEYRTMLGRAAGGGALLGFTTWFKFLLGGLALSAFWGGLAAGLNYALAFVLIQFLHFTVATKQPAVTAPAMVAKLRELSPLWEMYQDGIDLSTIQWAAH